MKGGAASGSSGAVQPSSTFDPSAYVPAAVPIAELRKLYSYDSKATLNAQLTDKRTGDGVILEDITFSDTRGREEIPAYVLGPEKFTGRLPAVVYAHGSDGNRDTMLKEGMALARLGALVCVPELPLKPSGDPVADSKVVADSVVALRRAYDLLIRRSDCDGSRVGFAGHSWGAAMGAVLYGIDSRITATVLASGFSRISRWMVRNPLPKDWHAYLDALSRFDAPPYIKVTGRKAVLLQFGKQDQEVTDAERAELADGVAGPKERKDYDTGHDLVGFEAAATDRVAFLRKQLRLK
ncbi:dienelactone hydrolase family protein [Dactylosporangium sp. NPDC000521]|uniref:dienelactone hydrolase family protein n=1 Tax=Dactylosporangium sp. NPDC000521 TaxID=3363975 RepID=UPI0036C15C7B